MELVKKVENGVESIKKEIIYVDSLLNYKFDISYKVYFVTQSIF